MGKSHHTARSWRRSAPRLLGVSTLALVTLLSLVLGFSGGASAIVGDTDLALTKSDSPDPVTRGSNLTYTIKVENTGTNDAAGVTVTDDLPSQVDYVSSNSTAGPCQRSGRQVTCDLVQVNGGTTGTVTIVVEATKNGTIFNTATVSATSPDTNAQNNSDTEQTGVIAPPKQPKKKGKKGKASCATPTITGTAGNDVLSGTSGGDVIVTQSGNDQVDAGGGKDLICAGAGSDLVDGGPGGDTAIGGKGKDKLLGGDGGDLLKGKAGKDKLRGQRGNDTLDGGKKKDNCKGGKGNDTLIKCP